jgi:hypothetical protein
MQKYPPFCGLRFINISGRFSYRNLTGMTIPKFSVFHALFLVFFYNAVFADPKAGFFLPDSVQEMRIRFRCLDNLIILPVKLNDSISVNLVLDTGCRNLVLFGKKFEKLLKVNPEKEIIFSGLGTGSSVKGHLSLNNKVAIQSICGQSVPVIVVPDKNLFGRDVQGVIGYEIFLKFEIEINFKTQTIIFRPALHATAPEDYAQVPLQVVDARPVMRSTIFFNPTNYSAVCDLMIDTGSSIGLLLKTTDVAKFERQGNKTLIGRGLNGLIYGYNMQADKLSVNGFEFNFIAAGIIQSDWHNHASIGMEILKDYIVVLNYCKSYACFKKQA